MEKKITLVFTIDEVNRLLVMIGNEEYRARSEMMANIQRQGNNQLQPVDSNIAEKVTSIEEKREEKNAGK